MPVFLRLVLLLVLTGLGMYQDLSDLQENIYKNLQRYTKIYKKLT